MWYNYTMVKEVYAYLQTHWDREWYKTFEEFRIRLCDVLNDIFKKLDTKEINSFYFDGQVVALSDYLEIYPEKLEYVKKLIKNKKLFIGPFYDLADEFLVNGESLARNLLIGISEAEKLGADKNDFVGYLPDAFGHCAYMPMLFKKAGIENAIVWRGVKSNSQEFLWISPDGSAVKTAYLPAGYFQDFLHKKSYKKNLTKLLNDLKIYTDEATPILLPIGGDHLACAPNIKAKIKNFNRDNDVFHIKLSGLNEYFQATKDKIPTQQIAGELRNNEKSYILMGTASSRIDLKKLNMLSQWELGKVIEPIFAAFGTKKEITDYAWKTLIKNHAHDSICGCSLDEVHAENITRYNKVLQITNTLENEVTSTLSEKISKNEVGIINSSNFDFSGVYRFYSDKKLPLVCVGKKKAFPIEISQDLYQAPVQEHYHTYYEYLAYAKLLKGCSFTLSTPSMPISSALSVKEKMLSNEYFAVKIHSDGTITLRNLISGKEISRILKITDEADVGDSYNFSCIKDDTPIEAKFINSKIIENSSLRGIIRLYYELKIPSRAIDANRRSDRLLKHIFEVDLIAEAFSKRLDIKINYENLSKDHILKLCFATSEDITETISEDTFGIARRSFREDYDYKNTLPLEKYKEADINTGVFQRFVMANGLCVITKGLQEYEVKANNLNITLLRSFGVISKKSLLTRTAAAGPPLPTPDGQMLGKQTAEISLVLTDDIKEAFAQADFFYNPLVVIDGKSNKTKLKAKQFLKLPQSLYVYSSKIAENRQGSIVKIFNISDDAQAFMIDRDIFEANLLEENLSDENLRRKGISFKPNELKIFRIY